MKKTETKLPAIRRQIYPLIIGGALVFAFVLAYGALPHFTAISYDAHPKSTASAADAASSTAEGVPAETPAAPVSSAGHIATPAAVKAIYMSQCVVGTPNFRNDLVKLVDTTELNSIIIDIKDFSGKISFTTDNPALKGSVSEACGATDMPAFIKTLHEKGIYVIGRLTVFQDPYYAKEHPDLAVHRVSNHDAVWKDHKGLAFIDVSAKPYWDFVVALSKESYAVGFDELNYDYVRFPSDGNMSDAYFSWSQGMTKPVALEHFFEHLHNEVKPTGVIMSADLFGMVTTNTDDLNIGQVLERALPYFDYIDPMVYPSHYPKSFNGWANPNGHPYDLIKFVMSSAVERTISTTSKVETLHSEPIYETVTVPATKNSATTTKQVLKGYTKEAYPATKMRPWLQDFSLGAPAYGVAEVKDQIKATYDAGLTSWLLWSASNRYTAGALEAE